MEDIKEATPQENLMQLVERGEKLKAELTELTARQEELAARQLMGGHSDAGQAPQQKKEVSAQDYAASVLAGRPITD